MPPPWVYQEPCPYCGQTSDRTHWNCLQKAVQERDEAQKAWEQAEAAHNKALAERDKALVEISVLATELEDERTAPTEGWVPASAWDKVKTALAVCDACCKERIRERDEARATAEMALAIIIKPRKDWNAEDADLVVNDVPWKRSEPIREISARVLKKMREEEEQ